MIAIKKNVILRADGNGQIGLGHVYRLLALSEMLKNHFNCTFVIDNPDLFILMEIKKSCNRLINLENKRVYQPADKIKAGEEIDFDMQEILIGNEIVVTDGYLFGKKYQVAVKSTGASLVSIDDLASMELFADVIINHAPGINRSIYKIQSYSQLLTGLDYAIIRKPFLKPLKERNQDLKYKAFISLGGSDLYGFTENLLDLLTAVNMFEELHILCSSSFETSLLSRLKKKQFGNPKIKMHFNLDAEALVALLDDSTHAFVSASTVLIESYSRGLKCFTGYYVNNQKFIYDGFVHEKMAIGLGDFRLLNNTSITYALSNQGELSLLHTSLLSGHNILESFQSLAARCN